MSMDMDLRMERLERLLALNLMASGPSLPITSVATVFAGSQLGLRNRYLELYKNNYPRLVAVKVLAEFSGVGQAANLSYETTNNGKIDKLDVFPSKLTSDTIWLKPNQTLYINNANPTGDGDVDLTGAIFRVLLFDPISFV